MNWKTTLVFGIVALAGTASAQAQTGDAQLERGKMIYFNRGCRGCHGIGKRMIAPDLAGLESRRSKEWIYKWLKETDVMLASDSTAIQLAAEYNNAHMPKQHLSDQDIDALLAYLRAEEAKASKK
jgi:mono/diheme cytochrome c family protein